MHATPGCSASSPCAKVRPKYAAGSPRSRGRPTACCGRWAWCPRATAWATLATSTRRHRRRPAATDLDAAPSEPSPAVVDLAITDYDSLSASQVVTRLPGLSNRELESVRAYEATHRGRKTILNKVAQLQA
jgi:hypothetical protein